MKHFLLLLMMKTVCGNYDTCFSDK